MSETVTQLREELKQLKETYLKKRKELSDKLYSQPEVIIDLLQIHGVNKDYHPFLFTVLSAVKFCEPIKGKVDHYRTPIPFNGLEVVIEIQPGNKKTYVVMWQADNDYSTTLESYCEGKKPYIQRLDTNIYSFITII